MNIYLISEEFGLTRAKLSLPSFATILLPNIKDGSRLSKSAAVSTGGGAVPGSFKHCQRALHPATAVGPFTP